jgi:hypothetical protein
MCKKRYEDVWGQSRVLHSLCSWWANDALCEKIADPYMCKRYMGDYFYSDVRFHEFGDLCDQHCLVDTEENFASMFSTKGNDASAQIDSWRSTKRKPPEATKRRPFSPAELEQIQSQPGGSRAGSEEEEGGGGRRPRGRRGSAAAGGDKEAELKQRVFAQLHEKLHRQKEEEREAKAVAEEEAAAAAARGEGEASVDSTDTDTHDDEPRQPEHGSEGRRQAQADALRSEREMAARAAEADRVWEERARQAKAASETRRAALKERWKASIDQAQDQPPSHKPAAAAAAPVGIAGMMSDPMAKAREAVASRQQGKDKLAKGKGKGMGMMARGSSRARERTAGSSTTPPIPFMHERASQEKIAREDAAKAAANALKAGTGASGAAAFDPLYGPM